MASTNRLRFLTACQDDDHRLMRLAIWLLNRGISLPRNRLFQSYPSCRLSDEACTLDAIIAENEQWCE